MKIKYIILAFLMLISLLSSCTHSENTIIAKKIDTHLNELVLKHENYKNNSITRQAMVIELETLMDSIAKLNILSDIPMEVLSIKENPHGDGALVHLYHSEKDSGNLLSNYISFDVIGFMDLNQAAKIDEKASYYINGYYMTRINYDELMLITGIGYNHPDIKIEKSSSSDSMYNFNLGCYMVNMDSFTLVK